MTSYLYDQFEKFLQGMSKNMFKPWDEFPNPSVVPLPEVNSFLKPHLDIQTDDNNYILQVDMPGVEEKDLSLELKGNILTVTGERKAENLLDNPSEHSIERYYGTLSRSIELVEDADISEINAKYKNGVLTITVPRLKKPELPTKKISISAE